ncbi:hypothetical protein MCEGKSH29_00151 [Candidatus Nanopelagicaceae bacterium]
MKIDRSRETALNVVRDVSKVNAENVEMIDLSREIAELGFEHQFERADRRAVRDALRNLIEVQVKPELANEI